MKALESFGIKIRSPRVGENTATCPKCSHERRKKNNPCLSVKIEPEGGATWNCNHCGWTGGMAAENNTFQKKPVRKIYRRPTPVANPERPQTLVSWLRNRGISDETASALGIYRTDHFFPQTGLKTPCVAFPYFWNGTLYNVKYRDKDKNFAQEKDAEPTLFNADALDNTNEIIWAEGEMDVAAFYEIGMKNAVSLPTGSPSNENDHGDRRYVAMETHADALEKIEKFYIATDCDEKGDLLAEELARRLGREKCWRVRFPTLNDVSSKDANECLVDHGRDVLTEQIKFAEEWPIDGLYSVSTYAQNVLDLYHGVGPRPYSVMNESFDKCLRVIPGQFVVVTGIPNHGKSRFVDQVAIWTAEHHDWKWVIFSPETEEAQHISDLCELRARYPFFDGINGRMTENDLNMALRWLEQYFQFITVKEHTPSIDWILERAKASVLRFGSNNIVIDPYNEIEAGRGRDQTETEFVSQLISKLKRFAKNHGVTVWMVAHPTKIQVSSDTGKERIPTLYDISGSAHWRNKADAGVVVYRDYENNETIIQSQKIRRQPICGTPSSIKYTFLPSERWFAELPNTYQAYVPGR